jgi:hypothetical protein
MYDVIKYIWSLEDFRERFATMAVKAEREIESEVGGTLMTSSCTGTYRMKINIREIPTIYKLT